jgi:hypothetical protein
MILPTKYLEPNRALLSVGGEVLDCLTEPLSVSELWRQFRERRTAQGTVSFVSFDWFVLSLNLLFALSAIQFEDGVLRLEQPR